MALWAQRADDERTESQRNTSVDKVGARNKGGKIVLRAVARRSTEEER